MNLQRKSLILLGAIGILILSGLYFYSDLFGTNLKYANVGGKKNACSCTQRLEQ